MELGQEDGRAVRKGGPLDAIAYASGGILGAVSVVIAVADPVSPERDVRGGGVVATVRGSFSSGGLTWNGRRLRLDSGVPLGVVTSVDRHDREDGSLFLSTAVNETGGRGRRPAAGSRQVLSVVEVTDDGMVVLVEAPGLATEEVVGRSLGVVLEAAAMVARCEPPSSSERLRAGLQQREEERQQWARELHDETLQQMGALQVLLTSTLRNAATDPDAVPTALRTAIDLLAEEIASLRHLITELRPATLDELGLSAPLHALARRTEELTGLRVDVHVSLRYADGQIATRLLPDVELAVYRVVQEALTNASRHSGATQVRISVVEDDEEVWVEVADNGAGMSGTSRTPGFGITGMQERALLAGGHLDVLAGRAGDCDEGARGTVIRLVVPAAHRTDPDTGVLQGSSVSAPAQGPQS